MLIIIELRIIKTLFNEQSKETILHWLFSLQSSPGADL